MAVVVGIGLYTIEASWDEMLPEDIEWCWRAAIAGEAWIEDRPHSAAMDKLPNGELLGGGPKCQHTGFPARLTDGIMNGKAKMPPSRHQSTRRRPELCWEHRSNHAPRAR